MIDALIVGAGPTGLVLGCELIKRGLNVRLIEQLETPTDQSRALGLQSRTLEVFERMGILEEVLKRGRIIRQANFYYNSKRFGGVELSSHLKAPYPYVVILPQADTEAILTEHFVSLGGKIERGTALQRLGVIVQESKEEMVDAKWTFGCDGAHSTVRHALNLPFEGAPITETFAIADVEMQTALDPNQGHLFFQSLGLCGILPLPKLGWFRIILHPCVHTLKPDLLYLQDQVRRFTRLPIDLIQTGWISSFTIQRRITPKMRVGNVFVLGDAAHIHSPAGGQGLNTSVQDAFNLAWKIALVHKGLAKESFLDSFEIERHPVAKSVLRNTSIFTSIITSRFLKRLLIPVFKQLLKKDAYQRQIAYQISELAIAYHHSPIVTEDPSGKKCKGPKPGERAPDALLANGKRLFSLLDPADHTLLCFNAEACAKLIADVQERYAAIIRPVCIPDTDAEACSKYDAVKGSFYLIRPDGVIAYRSRAMHHEPFLQYLSIFY